MGKSSQKEKRLAGRVSLALAAGMFSVVPVAHGMPTFDKVNAAHNGGASVTFNGSTPAQSGDKPTSGVAIDSNLKNTIIDWKDFSVGSTEHVKFANDKNFMNIVTGKATSAIDGQISGTGDIYLINPNGVIFGQGAKVDVGNLYVSTREADGIKEKFLEGNDNPAISFSSVLEVANADITTLASADIVNLVDGDGNYVAANTVVMEGRNIRFLNVVNTTATGTVPTPPKTDDGITGRVTLRSNYNDSYANKDYTDGYIHIGHRDTDVAAVSDAVTDAYIKYAYGYVNSDAARTQDENKGVVDYTLVYNVKSDGDGKLLLTDIATKGFGKNYMLAENIDASLATGCNMTSTIGNSTDKFTGKFDGMFKSVNNLSLTGTDYIGLFGYTDGARIENVGVENERLDGNKAGGIVGYAKNSSLLNVWNAGWVDENHNYLTTRNNNDVSVGLSNISISTFGTDVGGIIGYSDSTSLTSSYNASYVNGSGLVGRMFKGTNSSNKSTISNSYNIGKLGFNSGNATYGIVYANTTSNYNKVVNVYSASNKTHGTTYEEKLTSQPSHETNGFIIESDTKYRVGSNGDPVEGNPFSVSIYSSWGTSSISNEGGVQADGTRPIWRIYEGYSLPLLTAFFQGTVSTDYQYVDGAETKQVDLASYNYGAGMPSKIYDANKVLGNTPSVTYLGINADSDLIVQNNRKNVYLDNNNNVSKFALFSGGQQGYDLYGNNFRIDQREISYDGQDSDKTFIKEYDGTNGGADALKSIFSATSGGSGFLNADAKDVKFVLADTVTATYNSPDVLNADTFTIANAETEGAITLAAADNATDTDAWKNYTVGTITNLNGTYVHDVDGAVVQIKPRSIKVSLKQDTGITKTYDGTSTVTNQNKGEGQGFLPSENLDIDNSLLLSRDSGVTVSYNGTARYVTVGANGLTDAVNAGDHKVAYEGIAITDRRRCNKAGQLQIGGQERRRFDG